MKKAKLFSLTDELRDARGYHANWGGVQAQAYHSM